MQPVGVRSEGLMVEQSAHDGIEFVERAVRFDAGVVLVDAVAVEEGGLAAIPGPGVDAHGTKVGREGPMWSGKSIGDLATFAP